MNKGYAFLLVLLVGAAGCGKKNKKAERDTKSAVASNVDIPTVDGDVRSFFDEEICEYALADDQKKEFGWEDQRSGKFKEVYFEFDKYEIKNDQKDVVASNLDLIKKSLEDAKAAGKQPEIIIEGHACHSAGSAVYNLALSEKRAKVLSDTLIASGIPAECVKIVGRGQEVPAIVDGKPVEGDRAEQWPNRRDEIRVLIS
jgi:outer membrane protein OmpA-like peptidoglycan-associated protein